MEFVSVATRGQSQGKLIDCWLLCQTGPVWPPHHRLLCGEAETRGSEKARRQFQWVPFQSTHPPAPLERTSSTPRLLNHPPPISDPTGSQRVMVRPPLANDGDWLSHSGILRRLQRTVAAAAFYHVRRQRSTDPCCDCLAGSSRHVPLSNARFRYSSPFLSLSLSPFLSLSLSLSLYLPFISRSLQVNQCSMLFSVIDHWHCHSCVSKLVAE